MASRMAALFVMITVLAAACGSKAEIASDPVPTATAAESRDAAEGEDVVELTSPTVAVVESMWTVAELDVPGDVSGVTAVEFGGKAAVLSSSADAVTAWMIVDEVWQASEIVGETRGGSISVAAAAEVPGGLLVALNDYETFVPQFWFSEDGLSWSPVQFPEAGLSVEVLALAATEDAVIVTGALSGSVGPGSRLAEGVIWRSEDLVRWKRSDLDPQDSGIALGVGVTSSGLIAIGRGPRAPAMWRSDDDGRSWKMVPVLGEGGTGEFEFRDIAVGDGIVVVVGEASGLDRIPRPAIATSTDGGRSWVRQQLDAGTAFGLGGASRVDHASGAFWIITGRSPGGPEDQGRCYVDLASCRLSTQPVVLRSQTGVDWVDVDLTRLEPPAFFSVDTVVGAPDGVLIVRSAGKISLWSWPSLLSPPLVELPEMLDALRIIDSDAQLEVGVTYRFPLYTHCGLGFLGHFNDTFWHLPADLVDNINAAAGQVAGTLYPAAGDNIYGFVTLVDNDTIEYSIPGGEVIATYESTDEGPPGCF